jgi:hypothetical protein
MLMKNKELTAGCRVEKLSHLRCVERVTFRLPAPSSPIRRLVRADGAGKESSCSRRLPLRHPVHRNRPEPFRAVFRPQVARTKVPRAACPDSSGSRPCRGHGQDLSRCSRWGCPCHSKIIRFPDRVGVYERNQFDYDSRRFEIPQCGRVGT